MHKGDYFFIVVMVAVAALLFFFFTPNANEVRKLRDSIQTRKDYIQKLDEESREAQRTIDQLKKDDPAAIEAIARDKFGYCRDGEEIYQVDKEAAAAEETLEDLQQ